MKILKLPQKKAGVIVLAGLAAALILIMVAIAMQQKDGKYSPGVTAKINEAAAKYGITAEAVKKDKDLMKQLVMDAQQEDKMEKLSEDITVSPEEVGNYKNMIGSSMDSKRALVILFNTRTECESFIQVHGGDSDPLKSGLGVIPMLQEDARGKYYNVVGNAVLEPVFDTLADGQYMKTPVEMSGVFCYVKRLGISSPVSDDEELGKLIKQEKASEMMHKEASGNAQ